MIGTWRIISVAAMGLSGFWGHRPADNGAMARPLPRLTPAEIAAVIAIAWDDKPPFHAVLARHGLNPGQVLQLLKRELTPNAFKVWKARILSSPAPGRSGAPRGGPKAGR